MEEQQQHIKLLAFRYFEGKSSREDAEKIFAFLKEDDSHHSIFRKWENDWINSLELHPELNERWEQIKLANRNTEFIKKSVPVIKPYRNYIYAVASIHATHQFGGCFAFTRLFDTGNGEFRGTNSV